MKIIKYLEWDSKFFGCPIGKVRLPHGRFSRAMPADIIRAARSMKLRCLYMDVRGFPSKQASFCVGREWILTDIRVVLERALTAQDPTPPPQVSFEPSAEQYSALKRIVRRISRMSRFCNDPHFGSAGSRALYDEWLRKSLFEGYADHFLTDTENGKPAGFLTVRIKKGMPYIDLLGVDEKYVNKGIATRLIRAAAAKLFSLGYREMRVVTQGLNAPALRAYAKNGFVIQTTSLFYHVWV